MDDSPGFEVLALLGGGALRVGLGYDGAGGVGANSGMISPLGKGHRGGALSISNSSALDNSWGKGSSGDS